MDDLTPADLLALALGWLSRAEEDRSMMAFHAVEKARDNLTRAAEGLPTDLAWQAREYATLCRAVSDGANCPDTRDLTIAVGKLAEAVRTR